MDVICESCGSTNRSAGEFCTECGAFLAWDPDPSTRPAEAKPGGRAAPRPAGGKTIDTTAASDRQGGDHQLGRKDQPITEPAPNGTGAGPTTGETTQATTA